MASSGVSHPSSPSSRSGNDLQAIDGGARYDRSTSTSVGAVRSGAGGFSPTGSIGGAAEIMVFVESLAGEISERACVAGSDGTDGGVDDSGGVSSADTGRCSDLLLGVWLLMIANQLELSDRGNRSMTALAIAVTPVVSVGSMSG